ncbi:MAG: DNA ligase D [Burkholderiaceae bacterium]
MPNDRREPLAHYWSKRDFKITSEPKGKHAKPARSLSFVIQKHAATRLHYDFRLELDGVLLSWAVPKGPSYDPTVKRMAIHVEDHPLAYGAFEGTIPPKQYGAGKVIVWDNGTWTPVGNPREGLKIGKLVFELHGQKMAGLWELVRIAKPGDRQQPWLLFKKRDAYARPLSEYDVVAALPDSVISKPLGQVAARVEPDAGAIEPAAGNSGPVAPSTKDAKSRAARDGASHSDIAGAIKAPLPDTLSPQLATLAAGIPLAGDWIYEAKWDGYRILTRIEKGRPRLITRGGHDWSDKMPDIVDDLGKLGAKSAWLDGEIVVLGKAGVPDFNALQKAFDRKSTDTIVYFLFDVLYLDGYDLRSAPLSERRRVLNAFLNRNASDRVRHSESFDADAASLLSSACAIGLEGIIAKRSDARYESRRTETWLKLKCKQRQEFVVCGFVDRTNGASQVGSLILGIHDDNGKLIPAGSVGTGWSADESHALHQKLIKLQTPQSPFDPSTVKQPGRWSRRVAGSERWLLPRAVAEVEFAEWTPDGQIRHASFVALRTDKPARAITREVAAKPAGAMPTRKATAEPAASSGIRVTHGERVIDPGTGLTKLDLVRYYESVAEWILPHLQGRPCSLVRGPAGVTGQLFFQKHGEKIGIPGITELDAALWPGHAALLEIDTAEALAGAAQMNVIEFHTWNSTSRNIDKPDRIVFDLDPGEGTTWQQVQEAATLVRTMLSELSLESWLKTSGGKGLHVVVPLAPRLEYDAVKEFSQAIVQHLARTIPSRFVARSGAANRVGKLFVDYLRNGHGATTAAAYSARSRPGMGVSMPVRWDELYELQSGAQWTIASAREYLSFQSTDPWAAYWKTKQTLTVAMKKLGFKPARSGA